MGGGSMGGYEDLSPQEQKEIWWRISDPAVFEHAERPRIYDRVLRVFGIEDPVERRLDKLRASLGIVSMDAKSHVSGGVES